MIFYLSLFLREHICEKSITHSALTSGHNPIHRVSDCRFSPIIMNIVDNDLIFKTTHPSYKSSTSSIATRAVGDRSDPWLHTASRVAAGVGLGISTSLLIMRFYMKVRIIQKFWWDDSMSIDSVYFYS
jgi:hypothetical protein